MLGKQHDYYSSQWTVLSSFCAWLLCLIQVQVLFYGIVYLFYSSKRVTGLHSV